MVPSRARLIHLLAAWAEELDGGFGRKVGEADGKHSLVFAVNAWADTKVAISILVQHLDDAAVCKNVTCMDEAVQHLGGGVDGRLLVIQQFLLHFQV